MALADAVLSDETFPRFVTEGDRWAVVRLGDGRRRNAIDLEGWERLAEQFRAWATDGPDVVVVRGTGSTAFSAGADISEFPERRTGLERADVYNRAVSSAVQAVSDCASPVLAMVNGMAVGGGCELAAACDIRIAAEDAVLGLPIGRLGVILGISETQALLRLLGPAKLKWLVFTGTLLTAKAAQDIGLVEEVVPAGELAQRVVAIAGGLLGSSRNTITATKFITDMCWRSGADRDAERLTTFALQAYGSEDFKDRVGRFLSKTLVKG
jgi:enoyl-CoA hydratase